MFCQEADRIDPTCLPYFEGDFSNLCSTTIQCGVYDSECSQSEGYANKLRDNHVNVFLRDGSTELSKTNKYNDLK